jgi:hypothetical protein
MGAGPDAGGDGDGGFKGRVLSAIVEKGPSLPRGRRR